MNHEEFWQLIEQHVSKDEGEVDSEPLVEALVGAGVDQVVAFDTALWEVLAASYTQELWGAAYLINGGCSDDGFDYFRGWLLAQGREVYERAVRDPESLVDIAEEGVECEDILYVAYEANDALGASDLEATRAPYPELGEDWDFDDNEEMRRRYPKLFAKFGEE